MVQIEIRYKNDVKRKALAIPEKKRLEAINVVNYV